MTPALRENQNYLGGKIFWETSVEERRRFNRIHFSEAGIHFSEDEGIFGIFKTPELSISLGIKDISKGGLNLASTKDQATAFRKSDILIFTAIKGTTNIEFDEGIGLEIKWMQESDKSGQVAVGCEFKEISENTREQINQFVGSEIRWKGMRRKDSYKTDNEVAELQEVYTISKRQLKMLISGLGVVVLSAALFLMLPKGNIESLNDSLESIEDRVSMLEKGLEEQKSLNYSITILQKQAQELEEDIGSLALKTEAKQRQKNAPTAPATQKYHEVHRGENLYRIALKYEISVDDLCNLNGISTDQFIQPGQKLAVP
jgi:LysM repeat protein